MSTDAELMVKKEEIAQAQEKLLKMAEGSEERDVSWWRTCLDVSISRLRKVNVGKTRDWKKGDLFCKHGSLLFRFLPQERVLRL